MSNKQTQSMTQAQFAARHHVSRRTVNIWRAAGLVVLRDGKIDVAISDNLLGARLRRYRGGIAKGPATEPGDDGLTFPELPEPPPLGPLPPPGPR
jgi:hypothetical protein